jgi:hypothetical protein|tara:strand:- start:401 stop:601 length:201 start_codon:yes stop_codon:yes gene_type:complete
MKLLLVIFIVFCSFLAPASTGLFVSNGDNSEISIGYDRGKKKRKRGRKNKKRKKKCRQFQRRVFAG